MCSHYVVKLIEATQNNMIDYVREMTVKKSCNFGKYGLFEHLLFLFLAYVTLLYFLTIFSDLYHLHKKHEAL